MALETMERRAADNKYLHREFHNFFNLGLIYAREQYGEEGVEEYLRMFTNDFYSPLIADIKKDGLSPLARHFENIYEIEEASDRLKLELSENKLEVYISSCPGIEYIKKTGRELSPDYKLSSTVVFDEIAKLCGIKYECVFYDDKTGKARHIFTKGE